MKYSSPIVLWAVLGLGLLASAAAVELPPLDKELDKFAYESNKTQFKEICLKLRSLTESELTKVPADVASDHVFQAMFSAPIGVYEHVGRISERADKTIAGECPIGGMTTIKTRTGVGRMLDEYEKFLSDFSSLYHYDNFHIPEDELQDAEMGLKTVVRSPILKRLIFATLKYLPSPIVRSGPGWPFKPEQKIERTCKFVDSTIQILTGEYRRYVGQEGTQFTLQQQQQQYQHSDHSVGGVMGRGWQIKSFDQLGCATTQMLSQIKSFCELYKHKDGLIYKMLIV